MDEHTGDFVVSLIEEEGLGDDSVPDLLLLSLSSLDEIGHDFGPFSLEVGDAVWRADRVIARIMEFLSKRLDLQEECIVVLTSDHGMAPIPKITAASGKEAGLVITGPLEGEVDGRDVKTAIEATLDKAFGEADWVLSVPYPSVHLNLEEFGLKEKSVEEGVEAARSALLGLPGVKDVITSGELALGRDPGIESWMALQKWYFPDRCGDLVVDLMPYYIWSSPKYARIGGTNHGSRYDYDTRIPLVFYGKGIKTSERKDPASQVDIVPSILELLGIKSNKNFDGRPLF
jgi:arylsulfatase A-like enzyme